MPSKGRRTGDKPARSPPTRPSRPAPAPTITGLMATRARPLATIVGLGVAVCAFAGALFGVWTFIDGPLPVSNKALTRSIGEIREDVKSRVDIMKGEVLGLSAKHTEEVKTDVGGVKRQIETLSRKADGNAISMLEVQARTLFLQKTNLTGSLTSVEVQLRQRPADTFLMQRKAELENFIRYVDRESDTVQEQLRRAKNGAN